MTLLSAKDLSFSSNGQSILSHIDLTIERGEIVTIIGPNGSGKSTLLRALLGIARPSSGRVTQVAGLRIGYVPQRLHIDPGLPLTVARFMSLPERHTTNVITAALTRVGVSGTEGQQMAALSGGQFQRVLLARAFLSRPDVLMLDEPTQGLDQPGEAALYTLIAKMRAELNCAVLMVSHDLHVVMSASDRVICLNRHICCQGAPRVVSNAPEYRALFGLGTQGALALYQHIHDHDHDASGACQIPHDQAPHPTQPPPKTNTHLHAKAPNVG